MLVIRLSRIGKKNKPYYKIVIQEKAWAPKSKAVEIVGSFDPHQNPAKIELKEDRIKHWLEQGAQPSNTVHNMLVNAGILKADKKRAVSQFKTRKKKGEEEEGGDEKKPEDKKEEPKVDDKPEEKKSLDKLETKKEEVKEEPKEEKKEEVKTEDKKIEKKKDEDNKEEK